MSLSDKIMIVLTGALVVCVSALTFIVLKPTPVHKKDIANIITALNAHNERVNKLERAYNVSVKQLQSVQNSFETRLGRKADKKKGR